MFLRRFIREQLVCALGINQTSEIKKIFEELKTYDKKIIKESTAAKKTPTTFNHLKWSLNSEQKHFLNDFIELNPDQISEKDYEYASKITGIPKSSIKSIQNTYGTWNVKKDDNIIDSTKSNSYGRFSVESKKVITAKEYDIPQKYRNDVVNFKTISKEEADNLRFPKKTKKQKEYESNLGSLIKGSVKKSNVKKEENFNNWLMYYILGELKPKDAKLNEVKNTIEIDFVPTDDYYDFHKSMLNSNKKSKFWISTESLINQFNEAFNTSYIVEDQLDLVKAKANCIRLIIKEINYSDKVIWDSDAKVYVPWEYATEYAKKQYINNQAHNMTKPIPEVDFNELLNNYINFDNSMFQGL